MTLQTVLDDIQKRPGTGDVIPVFDPATEEQITEFKDCGPEAVNDAVARAKASFESGVWHEKSGSERAKVLWRVADLIDQNTAVLAELESLNAGMTPLQAQGTVVGQCRVFPVLRRLVHQDRGDRGRRAHRRSHRLRLAHAHLHAQRALRCGRADLPLEWTDLQFLCQARAVARGGLQQRRQAGRGDATLGARSRWNPGRGRGS